MALGEVRRRHPPALTPADQHAQVVDRQGARPDRRLRRAVEKARADDQRGPERRRGHHAQNGAEQIRVSLARDRVEHEVEKADGEVREPEQHAVGVEGLRDGERDEQHGAHRPEHGQAHGALLGVERVGEPGVRRPRPPERGEDEQPAAEPLPGGVGRHEAGDLRDGEDEDEVEEELERSDALLALSVVVLHHRETLEHGEERELRPVGRLAADPMRHVRGLPPDMARPDDGRVAMPTARSAAGRPNSVRHWPPRPCQGPVPGRVLDGHGQRSSRTGLTSRASSPRRPPRRRAGRATRRASRARRR